MINACKEHKYLKVFSPRSRLRKEIYDRLVERWPEFGLDGPPPRITHFEEAVDGKTNVLPIRDDDNDPGTKT